MSEAEVLTGAEPVYGDPEAIRQAATYVPSPTIIVYSDDQSVRHAVISALGTKLSGEVSAHKIVEFATAPALRQYVDDKKKVDLFILDSEAVPEGGMGIAHQLRDEMADCPPIMVIIQRSPDKWLAKWSGADAVVAHPIDPFTLGKSVLSLLHK